MTRMDEADPDVIMEGNGTKDEGHLVANGLDGYALFNGKDESSSTDGQSDDEDTEMEEDEPGHTDFGRETLRRGLLPTGVCYDDRMKLHANADFGSHPHHPEDPRRVGVIMGKFKEAGLVYTGSPAKLVEISRKSPTRYMWRIPARAATQEEICLAHLPRHYSWVAALSHKPTAELRELTKKYDQGRDSIYVGSMTFEAALLSSGGAIETCKRVAVGHVKNAFAVIRPPGHHAEYDAAMGFCMFNNVPIAVKVCQKDYPSLCRKIMILDWDVHHGNGIQNIFYTDPNVLYISLHVYQDGNFYPGKPVVDGLADGNIDKCGTGPGLGRNVNIGWHNQGMGDGEYMAAFQKIVMPIAQEFDPDMVIISAGFDAADGDELGGCFVSPACYAHMTHMLMSLANGKVAVCLEGGYNLEAISKSALAVAKTLMGEPPPRMQIPKLSKDAARVLAKVRAYQAPYWECMRPGIIDVPDLQAEGGVRLHEIVRAAQFQNLLQKHGMFPMYVQREALFRSFENQVLVTPDILKARRILVIIHDPPELVAQPDPLDNSVEAHNAWINDGVTQYIDWAVSEKFAVLDVNVPCFLSHDHDRDSFTPKADEHAIQAGIQELICYIWDNYLQLYDNCEHLFIMGVGSAYLGVKMLLINRGDCKDVISGIINFVTGNLRPVKSDVDEHLPSWYKDNSRVYVANDHACWQDEKLTRKLQKKRFGTVIRSPQNGLSHMMREHASDVHEFIMGRVAQTGDTTEDDEQA